MRILHVHSGNLYGGVETLMMTLARGADHQSSMQSEFALCFDNRLARELRSARAEVHLLGEARTRNPLSVMAARRRLRQLIGERQFDAVVTHMPWAQALFGSAVRSNGVPLVFWMHDAASGRHWLERWASLTRPDLVLCNSHYTASTLKWLYPKTPVRVIAYPVAIRSAVVKPQEARAIRRELDTSCAATVIIQTSRMEAWKGHELHLRALGKLRDQPDWIVWFAGGAQRPAESSYQAKLKRMALELGIAKRVRFLGHRTDIPKLLKAADIYCQPNQGPEPFGIVFIEALTAGLPVVSVDFGGAREIVDQTCGALAPPGDAIALAVTLRRLIADADERHRLGAAGPARARGLCDPATQMSRIESAIATITRSASVTADLQPRLETLVNGKNEELPESASAPPMVSVVIPTFNGAARLPRVLTALAAQDAPVCHSR
jgi:glycosyltransferase involved in cell wall biosynthesis